MDRKQNIQAALKKAFCLSPRLTVAIAIPSFVFVFVMLGVDATPPHTPLFYLACLLSSYALVITITGAPGVVRSMQRLPSVRCNVTSDSIPWARVIWMMRFSVP